MVKIAALTLDIYDDADGSIARQLPPELHSVTVDDQMTVDALSDRDFGLVMKTAGDTLRRRFPVHNADALKLSEAYFAQTKDRLPVEAATVAEAKFAAVRKKFAGEALSTAEHDCAMKVAYVDITALKPQSKKVANTEEHWGLTIDNRNCFPLHNDALVKTAIARFSETGSQLEPEERFQYARAISKRAEALGVEIPAKSQVNLYTNDRVNLGALKVAIAARKMAVGSKVATLVLDQLYEAAGCDLEQGSIEHPDSFDYRQHKQAAMIEKTQGVDLDQAIGVLQAFDKIAGLGANEYRRGLADPFAALFKKANTDSTPTMVDGVDLGVLTPAMMSNKFDDGFITDFTSNPVQVYQSLPAPVKAVVRQLAENVMNGAGDGSAPAPACAPGQPPATEGAADEGDPRDRLAAQYSNEPASIVY